MAQLNDIQHYNNNELHQSCETSEVKHATELIFDVYIQCDIGKENVGYQCLLLLQRQQKAAKASEMVSKKKTDYKAGRMIGVSRCRCRCLVHAFFSPVQC